MEKQQEQEHAHAHKHFRPFPNLAWSSLAGNSHFPECSHPSSDILPRPWFIGHKSQKKRETRTAQFREGAVENDEERVDKHGDALWEIVKTSVKGNQKSCDVFPSQI